MRRVVLPALWAASAVSGHPHPEFAEEASGPIPARPSGRIVGGTGSFTYQYDPDKLKLPAGVQVSNGHGLARDAQGRIYFTYQSPTVEEATRALIRWDPTGDNAELLGDRTLAEGVPHGLRLQGDALYHANNAAIVTKTDLDGNRLWSVNMTPAWQGGDFWPFKPTDSVPVNDTLYVADGYGRSMVHGFSTAEGNYTGLAWGGAGNSTSPQKFHTDHGIVWDEKREHLIVTDRENHRLQYVSTNGTHLGGVDLSVGSQFEAAGQRPCNVNFDKDHTHAVVPALDGPVGVFDAALEKLLAVIPVGKLLPKQCPHPHDAIFFENGDIAVCCWAPGFISYWRRVAE